MIANARMYSVSSEVAELWRALFGLMIERSGLTISIVEYPPPNPLGELWARNDLAGVFMCGLPFSFAHPQPSLIAAPVPAPPEFQGRPCYWSELVVRKDSPFQVPGDAFGRRVAFTAADSQSGYAAALSYFMANAARTPLFSEVVAPRVTPSGALAAVIDGSAEIAPIDAYAYRLLKRYRPDLTAEVRSVGRTASTPIPVLVASHSEIGNLQSAFLNAHRHTATARLMRELLLERFTQPSPESYRVLRQNFETAKEFWRTRELATRIHPAFG